MKVAEIIQFDDEKFLKLYSLPAESPENKRARLIYKALEIYERIKEWRKYDRKNKNRH